MTSTDGVRDALIWHLHREGLSIRKIAAEVDLSRSRVHQIIAERAEQEPPDNVEDDDEVVLFTANDARVVVEPLTYVGAERWRDGQVYARWVDAEGSVDELAIYRYVTHMANEGDDYEGSHRVKDDMTRQLLEAGWTQVEYFGGPAVGGGLSWVPPEGISVRCRAR